MAYRFPAAQRGDVDTRSAVAVILIVIAGLAYWQFAPAGWPLSTRPRRDPDAPLPPEVAAQLSKNAPNPPLYKWKDAGGQWHITDKPPKDLAFEKVVVDPNANVVPTIVPEVPGAPEKK